MAVIQIRILIPASTIADGISRSEDFVVDGYGRISRPGQEVLANRTPLDLGSVIVEVVSVNGAHWTESPKAPNEPGGRPR